MEFSVFPALGGAFLLLMAPQILSKKALEKACLFNCLKQRKTFISPPWYGMIVIKEVWVNV